MAGIGSMELLVILIVALFAIGPDRLPGAARALGRTMGALKKAMNEAAGELYATNGELKDMATKVNDELTSARQSLRKALEETDGEIRETIEESEAPAAKKTVEKSQELTAECTAVEDASRLADEKHDRTAE